MAKEASFRKVKLFKKFKSKNGWIKKDEESKTCCLNEIIE
jgi:hypothetical protein